MMGNTTAEIFIAALLFMIPLQADQLLFALNEQRREHFWRRMLIAEICYFLLAVIITILVDRSMLRTDTPTMYIIVFAISYLIICVGFQIPQIEVIFVTSCGYALQHIGYALGTMCHYGLERMGYVRASSDAYLLIPHCLLWVLVYFMIIRRKQLQGERREKDPRMMAIAIVILFSCLFLNVLGTNLYINNRSPIVDAFYNVICKSYAIICCGLAIYLEYAVSYMNYMNKQREFMEQLIRTQGNQLQMSQESVSIINRKCHDIKYQLKALKFINNTDQRQEQIAEIQKAISIYDSVYHTGNEALNLLLREKTLLCDEYEIQFSCMADGNILSFISTDDLYVLLGNALDNAIESVMKEEDKEKRVISLYIGIKKGIKCIHLENYCKEPVEFQDGLPITSKENKAYHGFGVRSMDFIAKKYHGNMIMKYTAHTFYLNFFFPQ